MVGPFSANTYMPGLELMAQEFSISQTLAYQTLSSYLIMFAVSSLFVGAVSDALGRKPVMVGGLLCYSVACLLACASPNYECFLASRALMGVFASVGSVLAMAVTRDLYTGQKAKELTSLIAIIFALAPAFAPIIGGWIVVLTGWRSVFIFLALLGASLALITYFTLTETLPVTHREPFRGFVLICNYAGAMRNPAFTCGVLCNGFIFMGSILFSAGAPDYVANIMKMSITDFGYLMIPLIGFSVLGSFACPVLTKRFGDKGVMRSQVLLMLAAGAGGAAMNYFLAVPYPLCLISGIIYSIAMSVTRPILTVYNLDYFPKNRGMAASIQQFFQTSAFAVCSSVWVPLVMGAAWKYDLVLLFCGAMIGVLWAVIMKTRPAYLPKE